MTKQKMGGASALNVLTEFIEIIPELTEMREAVEVCIGMQNSKPSLQREIEVLVESLAAHKLKCARAKEKLGNCERDLGDMLARNAITFKEECARNSKKLALMVSDHEAQALAFDVKAKCSLEELNAIIDEKESQILVLEKKGKLLENSLQKTRAMALAE